jgi:hypothetical protein
MAPFQRGFMASNSTMADEHFHDTSDGQPMPAELFSSSSYTYRAYGLTFSSEISFPQWPDLPTAGEADVYIKKGVLFGKDYMPPDSVQIETSPGNVLLRGSQSATILVSGGNTITVEQLPGGNPAVIRQILLGWALAGIFLQRGMLPLHGSALCSGDNCFVICAASGTGKSTLTAAFLNAGYTYLDDNVALIEYQEDIPFVAPGIPEIRLWEDTMETIAFEHTITGRVKPELNKHTILARSNFRNTPASLKKIFILRRTQDSHLSFETLTGAAKFQALWEHVFCVRFMGDSGSKLSLFENLQALAARVAVVEIRMPAKLPRPDELCDIIIGSNLMH